MPTRDTAQLLLEVDARIATAQRAVNQLAKSIQSDSATMEKSLGRVATAQTNLGRAMNDNGRIRAGLTNLSFQVGDVTQQLSLGVSAQRVFLQQSGQFIGALQMMGGEGNKFLQFIGGPWGIAIGTAAAVLVPLAAKLFSTGDETDALVEKMRKQADEAAKQEAANKIWERSIDGVREAQKKLRDELERSLRTEELTRQQNLTDAEGRLDSQRGALPGLQAQLRAAQADVVAKRRAVERAIEPGEAQGAVTALNQAQQKVVELQKQIAQLKQDIKDSEQTIRDAQTVIANASADASSSASAAIKSQGDVMKGAVAQASSLGTVAVDAAEKARIAINAYTDAQSAAAEQGVRFNGANRQILALTESFIKGKTPVANYVAALQQATKALKDAAKAAADAKKSGTGDTSFSLPVSGTITGRFGEKRPGHIHQGVDIAVPVGTSVKAPAAGTVIEAGTLPGYGNVVFIDHGGGTITRLAHLSKISVARGQQVAAGAAVGLSGGAKGAAGSGDSTGPHVHYEVRVRGKAVNPLTGRFATDEATAALKGQKLSGTSADALLRQENAFEEEKARLNDELLKAQVALVGGIEEQAKLAEQQVFAEERRYDTAKQNDVEEGKLTQAQADELKAKRHAITVEQLKAIELQKQVKILQEQDADAEQASGLRVDALRYEDEIAKTQAEHRRIQMEILDVVYEEKKAHLERLKLIAEGNGDLAEANRLQGQINDLPNQKARDADKVRRGTMDPLQAWADQIPKTTGEIIQAMQEIEARGLDSLASAITNVIMGTESLGKAFGDVARSIIAQIVEMTIRMLIFRALMSAFGGGGGGGSGGGSIAPLTYAAKGRVFAGGNVIPFANGGVVSGPTFFPMSSGRTGVMGEKGVEGVLPLTRDGQGRLAVHALNSARAANNNASGPIEVHVLVDASDDLLVKAAVVADQRIAVHEPRIIQRSALSTLKAAKRRPLMGRN